MSLSSKVQEVGLVVVVVVVVKYCIVRLEK
jgi:hypothetical protein